MIRQSEFRELYDRYIALAARISLGLDPEYSATEIKANYAIGAEYSSTSLAENISRDLDMHEDPLNNPVEMEFDNIAVDTAISQESTCAQLRTDKTYIRPTPILYLRSKIKALYGKLCAWKKHDLFGEAYPGSYFETIPRDIVKICAEFLEMAPTYNLTPTCGAIMWNGERFRALTVNDGCMKWDDGTPFVFSEESERKFHSCSQMHNNLHGFIAGVVVHTPSPDDWDTVDIRDYDADLVLQTRIFKKTENSSKLRKLLLLNILTNEIVEICDNAYDIVKITQHHIFFHNPHGFLMRVDVKMQPQTPIFSPCPYPYVMVNNTQLAIHDFDCVLGSNTYVDISWQGMRYRVHGNFQNVFSYFNQKILYQDPTGWNVIPLDHLFGDSPH